MDECAPAANDKVVGFVNDWVPKTYKTTKPNHSEEGALKETQTSQIRNVIDRMNRSTIKANIKSLKSRKCFVVNFPMLDHLRNMQTKAISNKYPG